MQTQTGVQPFNAPQLSLFTNPLDKPKVGEELAKQVKAPCRTSEKLMTALEEITGWKSEFAESPASFRNRSRTGMENTPAQGTFSIVDMSADWPANQFTAHRGKCDQLVGLVGDLVGELQAAKLELSRVRSAVAALPSELSTEEDDNAVLVDSFVPKFGCVETGNVGLGPRSNFGSISTTTSSDDEFEVLQQVGDAGGKLVPPPFSGWSFGGTTGIVEDTYLDWLIDSQERIAISVGKIESAYGEDDRQTVLKVEPLTSEFRVSARGEISAFYHWDAAIAQVKTLGPSPRWTRIGVGDAIIASTQSDLDLTQVMAHLKSEPTQITAESIAAAVAEECEAADRTLVLLREDS